MTTYTKRTLNLDDLMDYDGIFDEDGNLCIILHKHTEDLVVIRDVPDEDLEELFKLGNIKRKGK